MDASRRAAEGVADTFKPNKPTKISKKLYDAMVHSVCAVAGEARDLSRSLQSIAYPEFKYISQYEERH